MIRSHRKTIYETLGRESVHPFPARMSAGIALDAMAGATRPLRVLDPMMGSGTVLAIARSKGHRAIGIDIDPLAVLISRVWTTAVNKEGIRAKAADVLSRAAAIFRSLPCRSAYPPNSDDKTKQFARYWFDDYARRQLASLSLAISRVRKDITRDVLWCGLSRMIIVKQSGASLAMDLSHSRPHRVFTHAKVKPFAAFVAAVDRVLANCIGTNCRDRGPATRTYEGDARELPLEDRCVDLVVTSPPYLNAIDYMRCSKFSLVWMGHSIQALRRLRSESIGAELAADVNEDEQKIKDIIAEMRLRKSLPDRQEQILVRYVEDMRRAVAETARVLVPGGRAVYVVGENSINGTYIRNSTLVSSVAEWAGLRLKERLTRPLPANRRYLPPPARDARSATLNARMRREVVLSFEKPSR